MPECDRCADEYESYPVFIKDDFNDISEYVEVKERFGRLCKPCRAAVHPNGYFAGASEVEPKREVAAPNGATCEPSGGDDGAT